MFAISGYAEPFPDETANAQQDWRERRIQRSVGGSAKVRSVHATDNEAQRNGYFQYSSTGDVGGPKSDGDYEVKNAHEQSTRRNIREDDRHINIDSAR